MTWIEEDFKKTKRSKWIVVEMEATAMDNMERVISLITYTLTDNTAMIHSKGRSSSTWLSSRPPEKVISIKYFENKGMQYDDCTLWINSEQITSSLPTSSNSYVTIQLFYLRWEGALIFVQCYFTSSREKKNPLKRWANGAGDYEICTF